MGQERFIFLPLIAIAVSCGARTELEPTGSRGGSAAASGTVSGTASTSVSASSSGVGGMPPIDCESTVSTAASGGPCAPLSIPLHVDAACDIANPRCTPLDAEGMLVVPECLSCPQDDCDASNAKPHRVFAMNRVGSGHLIASCDATTLAQFIEEFDALRYLGATEAPRVASVGFYPCNQPGSIEGATYLGEALPTDYTDGASLAADWDLLIACSYLAEDLGAQFVDVVLPFVRDEGRGLFAVADYVCPGMALSGGAVQLNAVIGEAGLAFTAKNLGDANGQLDLPCVPDYPP